MSFPYRYAAFDLDGTIVEDDGTISESTVDGLRRLRAERIALFIVSGRSPYTFRLLDLARVLELFEPTLVLSDGDIRWNWRTGTVEEMRTVPDTVVPTLLASGITNFVVDTGRGLAASSRSAAIEHAIFYRYPRSAITVSDRPPGTSVGKITVYADPATVLAALRDIEGCAPRPAPEGKRCNVAPAGSCKAAGLARLLASDYGEPTLAPLIAFGDGDNDACLLRTAGAGVAMAVSEADAARGATVRLTGPLGTYLTDEFPRGIGDEPRPGLPCAHCS
jgi:HAD superfamily hydrolase (TIGR01484 family)